VGPYHVDMADGAIRTILVAEDDEGVRQLVVTALRRAGFAAITAANGREAMLLLEADDSVVDVLVSDANMPVMGGFELMALARARRPDLAVILASGTNRWDLPPERIAENVTLLEKPFTIAQLIQAVERVLEAP
jgi:two-component system, cell cycle sensor histidine kinase and response regulator CckA